MCLLHTLTPSPWSIRETLGIHDPTSPQLPTPTNRCQHSGCCRGQKSAGSLSHWGYNPSYIVNLALLVVVFYSSFLFFFIFIADLCVCVYSEPPSVAGVIMA